MEGSRGTCRWRRGRRAQSLRAPRLASSRSAARRSRPYSKTARVFVDTVSRVSDGDEDCSCTVSRDPREKERDALAEHEHSGTAVSFPQRETPGGRKSVDAEVVAELLSTQSRPVDGRLLRVRLAAPRDTTSDRVGYPRRAARRPGRARRLTTDAALGAAGLGEQRPEPGERIGRFSGNAKAEPGGGERVSAPGGPAGAGGDQAD
jgi:hypothetical protein